MKKTLKRSAPCASQTTGKYGFRHTLILTMIVSSLGLTSAWAQTAALAAENKEAVANTRQVIADSLITAKVKSEILADSTSKGYTVHVETTQGAVLLKGALANENAIAHVKAIAEKIAGVRSVDATAMKIARANK